MKSGKPKIMKRSTATLMVAAAMNRLMGSELQDFIAGLNVMRHRGKDRNSGRGCRRYRNTNAYRPTYVEGGGEHECARRTRQIARGMIPTSLVHPVTAA